MYKDKDKQREAVKLANRRYRAKGITKVSRNEGITQESVTFPVIPKLEDLVVDPSKTTIARVGDTVVIHEVAKRTPKLATLDDLPDHARAMIEKHWRPGCGFTKQEMIDRALARHQGVA